MELSRKLKICVAISVLALILKIVAFASPGWVIVKHSVREPMIADTEPLQETNADIEKDSEDMEKKMGVSVSFGMWYYKVCMCGEDKKEEDDAVNGDKQDENVDENNVDRHHHKKHHHHHHHHHTCYHRCYRKREVQRVDYVGEDLAQSKRADEEFENDIPEEFRAESGFISRSVEFARHARHELAAYVTVGLVLGLIGLISAIKYARGGATGKHCGRLTCSTQVLSSFFYWMAIVRAITYIIQLKFLRDHTVTKDDIWFSVPWCLIVGAVGAILMDVSAVFHLILISRDRKPAGEEYVYNSEKIGKSKVPFIAPKGYEQLVFPIAYPSEEAGPLPEKQSIA